MAEGTRGYAHRIDILAEAARVWRGLTESKALEQWCARDAKIDPRAGGLFRATLAEGLRLEGHIDVFEPARRLRIIHLPSAELPFAESAVVDDFILDSVPGGTIVRLLGSGIPSTPEWELPYRHLRTGWERAIARLKVFVERS